MQVKPLIALAVVLIAWALVSAKAARFSVTVPVALMLAGLALSGTAEPRAVRHDSVVRHVLEATLALILFTDAIELRPRGLRIAGRLPLRLLLIGFPLTVVAGFLVGRALFPAASGWILALAAAALAASDSSLASALLAGERVTPQLRAAVNIESGLNDGLAAPLVLFFLSAAVSTEYSGTLVGQALSDLAIAVIAGLAVGFLTGWLLRLARVNGWSTPRSARLAYLLVAGLAFAVAYALHGNVLVAAFVAGLGVRAADADLPEQNVELSHDVVLLLSALVWFAFGSILPEALRGLTWPVVAYAVLSLTVVRMLPVAASLTGVRLPPRDKLLLGWLGPAGLPSVILGLLALEQLSGAAENLVAALIAATVVLSVLAHGLAAEPIARRLSRRRGAQVTS